MPKLKFSLFFLIIFFGVLFFAKSSLAATYYVNATGGNDSRTTTQAQNSSTPWLTIQKCANNTVAGDTCSVAPGTYNERPNAATNGSSGNYITFISSSARAATIRGFDINGQYVRVEGFTVSNPSDTCDEINVACVYGIGIKSGAGHAQVVNNLISNWRSSSLGTNPPEGCPSDVYVGYNTANSPQYGIYICGDRWTFENNEINRLKIYTTEGYCDADYIRVWGDGHVIRNNFLHGTILSEVFIPQGVGCWATAGGGPTVPTVHAHVDCVQTWGGGLTNLTYDKNWCSEYHEVMIQGGSSNLNFTNSVFANGLATDYADHHIGGGLDLENTNGSIQTGNTFFNGGSGPGLAGGSANGLIRNNIVHLNPSAAQPYIMQFFDSSIFESYSLGYMPGGSVYCDCDHGHTSDYFDPTDKPNVDPLFVNPSNILGADGIPFTADDGLRLQSGSPARGAGYGGVDMGAYAYTGSTPPPTGGKKGDLNNDGKIDVIDLGIFLSNWNSTARPLADIDQDGRVDVTDLGILLSNWG